MERFIKIFQVMLGGIILLVFAKKISFLVWGVLEPQKSSNSILQFWDYHKYLHNVTLEINWKMTLQTTVVP